MKKKKKVTAVGVISGKDLVLNSANKLGKHDPLVRTGTGTHQDKKKYNRKGKKNQQLKKSLKHYGPSTADSFYFLDKYSCTA